jgi:hypothetical protein
MVRRAAGEALADIGLCFQLDERRGSRHRGFTVYLSSYEFGTGLECRDDFVALSTTDRFGGPARAVLEATASAKAAAIMEVCFIIRR